jgi:hypothetical protein
MTLYQFIIYSNSTNLRLLVITFIILKFAVIS